jgi:septal ring factor EnvC (AmiA/AmiB activator)
VRRPLLAALALALALPLAVALPAARGLVVSAWAQPSGEEDAQQKELDRIKSEAAEKRRRAQELKIRESKVLKDLRATEARLRTTKTNIGALNKREQALTRQLSDVRLELDRSRAALLDQRGKLALRLRRLYMYGRARELEFFLSARSFAQLLTRWDFLTRVARQDRRILLGITDEKEQIEWNQRRLDTTHEQVDKNLDARTKEQKRLDQLAQQKKQSVSKIQGERKEYEAAAAELESTARRIQALLAELEKKRREEEEARRRAEQGTPAQPGQPAPPPLPPYEGEFAKAHGQLDWPLRGEVVGRFGNETHPRFGTVTFNNGIDIKATPGETIRAVAKGRVDFVSNDYGSYGEMLILNHGSGYYTLYAHCSDILVARGAEIAAGQAIARAGDSGSLKGTILHFEVRKGRQSFNPLEWLR